MIMKVTSDEKEQLSAAIDRMNEGLDVFIQFYNESEKDEPLIQLEDDTAKLMKEARELYGQDKLNETLNAIIKQILSISLSEEGKKNEVKPDFYFLAEMAVIYQNRLNYPCPYPIIRADHLFAGA